MPHQRLKAQLATLEELLTEPETPLTDAERETMQQLATDLKARLIAMEANEATEQDPTLVDGVNLLVEQLEIRHPTTAATLRSVMQTLSDIGI
jgi:hypothetical protein